MLKLATLTKKPGQSVEPWYMYLIMHLTCTWYLVLAAQSSSRGLVVGPSVGLLIGLLDTFMKNWPFEYQMVSKTYLPSNLCDISYSGDSSDSSDSCDCSDSSHSPNLPYSKGIGIGEVWWMTVVTVVKVVTKKFHKFFFLSQNNNKKFRKKMFSHKKK